MNQPSEKELAESLEYVRDVTWHIDFSIPTPVEMIAGQMKIHGVRIAAAFDATLGSLDAMSQAYADKVIALRDLEPLRAAAVKLGHSSIKFGKATFTNKSQLLAVYKNQLMKLEILCRELAEKGEGDEQS